uniref:PS II complex 12 kDa extrinsic protein n=1 Tax=Chromera velia CCMP2878 TaxID=1169474 RepID=A0A0G4I157_9ALVE|eukprot:Cvel_36.t1-p1 / transcript=Cvel_36.t1 / gene=Cvel_36 / organism=Chromera_velia_CCMP2878 / gene_product=hypothetical protein / transcript_product=hypothetical protein / location=Cvel_scaffold5:203173-203568(-) / protein_length=132 / sequence_SO=supercontig / SO=protein_coding / is_pseudo=false
MLKATVITFLLVGSLVSSGNAMHAGIKAPKQLRSSVRQGAGSFPGVKTEASELPSSASFLENSGRDLSMHRGGEEGFLQSRSHNVYSGVKTEASELPGSFVQTKMVYPIKTEASEIPGASFLQKKDEVKGHK